ncbi:MAG: MTAP family purine nucleoside phosphorylase [Magnetococcales bacterium]|nr:MTAP family purine nucleoside phosphorylase [Magnetococcales bacterium]MBF0155930.1 MTAP family purine nucleoside phosphorylase [Magnetococcales bacterium]
MVATKGAPQGALALIGGSGLREAERFRSAPVRRVATPYGEVELSHFAGGLFLQRHGVAHYVPPHRVNHKAHLAALEHAGAGRILAVASVGSLRPELPPGTLVMPDDFFAPHLGISFFDDARGHRTAGFDREWRDTLLEAWRRSGMPLPHVGGVYWQSVGPRFETPAEIRFHQPHCHLVGMTAASEAILAGELGIPYAVIAMVDNFANGIDGPPLELTTFKALARRNEARLVQTIETLVDLLR